jgi:putative ABC transport system ATP-binding protein
VSPPLGLLVLGVTPLVVVGLHRLAHALRNRSAAEQAHAADAAGVATDLVRGVRVLKGLGAEPVALGRYRRASRASLAATLRAAVAENALAGANALVGGALLVLVALVGGRLALDGAISVGELIAVVGLTQFLVGPLQRIGYAAGLLAQARASADRVAAVLAAPPVVAGGDAAPPEVVRGALTLRALRLTEGDDRAIDLDIAPGEHVAIVCEPADAGALLDVLARRAEPVAGDVLVDGVALRELPLATAHRPLLVADHDADLFEGSVGENVAAAVPHLEPGWRDALLAATAADEAVAALPGGVDAPVGERGGRLSGGQRQRVALARALAADPAVLVLHDPTTAVDAVTEARIATGVRELRADRTTIVVASSPALLAVCDRVVALRGGAIAAEGTHDELVASDTAYREAVLS